MKFLSSIWKDESGATAVEYAVMLALILAVIITAISAVGSGTGGMWSGTRTSLNAHGF